MQGWELARGGKKREMNPETKKIGLKKTEVMSKTKGSGGTRDLDAVKN